MNVDYRHLRTYYSLRHDAARLTALQSRWYLGKHSVQAILEDPSRREIVVKALQEALAAFGYKDTLKSLEAESKITY